jgi:general L-amino acid transport system permease protein
VTQLAHTRSGRPFRAPIRSLRSWWGEGPLTQLAVLVLVALAFRYLTDNLWTNMHEAGITPGFAFLDHAANFEIGESSIAYEAGQSYARAILVGLLNTVKVAVIGCVLATVLGVTLGIFRLSSNPLLAGTVQGYVELIRNTPLLLQLFFWNATLHALPGPRQALAPVPGILLSNRGIFLPGLVTDPVGAWAAIVVIGLAVVLIAGALTLTRAEPRRRRAVLASLAGLIALTIVGGVALGARFSLDLPALHGFNIAGGVSFSPEFTALLVGLVVNTAASIAETVRGGILSLANGQWEAGAALGFSRLRVLRLIVLPQALHVIIPVMTSSYLSLTKNSTLAVAIGFPDLVSVLNTTGNTTGQALETIFIMMVVYLALSLVVSVLMNAYNARQTRREHRGR